jgi:uncharacterized membrane protein YjjB (DUF3815 family)
MARKTRQSTKTNKWLWYGLYAIAGYYGYNWFKQYQANQVSATTVIVPVGTQQQ